MMMVHPVVMVIIIKTILLGFQIAMIMVVIMRVREVAMEVSGMVVYIIIEGLRAYPPYVDLEKLCFFFSDLPPFWQVINK